MRNGADRLRLDVGHVGERHDPTASLRFVRHTGREAVTHAELGIDADDGLRAGRGIKLCRSLISRTGDDDNAVESRLQITQRSQPDGGAVRKSLQQLAAAKAACGTSRQKNPADHGAGKDH